MLPVATDTAPLHVGVSWEKLDRMGWFLLLCPLSVCITLTPSPELSRINIRSALSYEFTANNPLGLHAIADIGRLS